jgi:hypothetical protein
MPALTRRQVLARGLALGGGLAVASGPWRILGTGAPDALAATATGWSTSDYWAFVDGLVERLEDRWQPAADAYAPVSDSYATAVNAHMLLVHAVAAAAGHDGPARRDQRARLLVQTLCRQGAPYREQGTAADRADKMFHVPGWVSSLTDPHAVQDKAIDPKVAQALAAAHRAAAPLGLTDADRALIADRVDRCARGTFFRYPHVRLNQINWNCELYALAAELTGRSDLLLLDYREHVLRFVERATRADGSGSPNLGPGYRFVYLPHEPPKHPYNVDSAEYSNETLQFIRYHAQARRTGMAPLPLRARDLLKAWVERALLGYWTHAGYLNWDTGLGFKRWHIGKVWGLALEGMLAIALSPEFHADARYGPWARHLFERGLETYGRFAKRDPEGGGTAPPVLFGLDPVGQGPSSRTLFAARMAANAARALAWGLPAIPAAEPPPFYAYDPDTGRLAVSTPSYATAVVPRNHRAFPYGGLEPARLHDADMGVAATIGGSGPAAFGVCVRDAVGRVLLDSQSGATTAPHPVPHVKVARVSAGGARSAYVTAHARPYPKRPYAGTFTALEARGSVRDRGITIATRHRFGRDAIDLRWDLSDGVPGRRLRWDARFPSWGPEAAVTAHLEDGTLAELADGALDLGRVAWLRVRSADSGYVVVPRTSRDGLVARLVRPAPERANPQPGPTLVIGPPRAAHRPATVFAVRIAVAAGDDRAAALAARLRN